MINVEMTDLLIFFDEQLSLTDEEQGVYWFRTIRDDGVRVRLMIALYEGEVSIGIDRGAGVGLAFLFLKNCSQVRVLDERKKCLEIIHQSGTGRCVVAIFGDPIVEYAE